MSLVGQTAWGALPRRQRRLQRSTLRAQRNIAVLILTAALSIAGLVAYVSLAPLY